MEDHTKTWPERIYLQHGDSPEVPPFNEVYTGAGDGVTWCQDKIEDADVEYVRADAVPDRNAVLEEAARIVEGGSFLHDQAPTAQFAKEAAAAIRRAIDR